MNEYEKKKKAIEAVLYLIGKTGVYKKRQVTALIPPSKKRKSRRR